MSAVPHMDHSDRKRRIRRSVVVLFALVVAIYVMFIVYAMTRH